MQQLEQLIDQASALAAGVAPEAEVVRQMQICNACRYCEGFCAVFPAMTRRLEFSFSDVHYLANLCHNCGACLHACQYAPPHEFAVNVPRAMAQVRVKTYQDFAWPTAIGAAYRHNGLVIALVCALALTLCLVLAAATGGSLFQPRPLGNFYSVIPHGMMVTLFGAEFGFAAIAMAVGVTRFWRSGSQPFAAGLMGEAVTEAVHDALTLKYLDGGHGEGCNNEDDSFSMKRRLMHHLTFYGFMLCFAATCIATVYHYGFGWHAPYSLTSLPVLLGSLGGTGLLLGPAGLLILNLRRHPMQGDPRQRPKNMGFIALLLATSTTGLGLLALRETAALRPYGKFAHAIYRLAALLKYAIERRQPNRLQLGSD
jgi:citrate/tricarballylate utilization protein